MNWRKFLTEIHFWPYFVGSSLLVLCSWIWSGFAALTVFFVLVWVEFVKAMGLFALFAIKRMTLNQFFWLDNLLMLVIVIGGWFLVWPLVANLGFWPVLGLYVFGWGVVVGIVNRVFKRKRSYETFDLRYGAPAWMDSWFDGYDETE